MVAWSIELSKFDFQYESRTSIKGQVFADFLAEMVDDEESQATLRWTLYVDGASNTIGSRAGVILEKKKKGDIIVELSIKFDFPISNNQAKCDALIVWL